MYKKRNKKKKKHKKMFFNQELNDIEKSIAKTLILNESRV